MKYSIGIDIGKFEFVMAIYGQHTTKTYTNDANGISLFLNEYKTILQEALTVV